MTSAIGTDAIAAAMKAAAACPFRVTRLGNGPIITPDLHPSIGTNIQGPSLIRVPDWAENRLGDYYLYFADHKGRYIRLVYADQLTGPWTIHVPGALHVEHSCFPTEPVPVTQEEMNRFAAWIEQLGVTFAHDLQLEMTTPHVASPDVWIDEANRRFIMTYHGLESAGVQFSRAATSPDGIHFTGYPENIGPSYIRSFLHDGWVYGMAMPGVLLRSRDGLTAWEKGRTLFDITQRHVALLKRGTTLHVFWTRVGDAPESILHSTIDISADWTCWEATAPTLLMKPEHAWEGSDAPVEPSVRSTAYGMVNQLRDPAIFEEEGRTYLLYAVAGESGLAIAELNGPNGGDQ